ISVRKKKGKRPRYKDKYQKGEKRKNATKCKNALLLHGPKEEIRRRKLHGIINKTLNRKRKKGKER
ncbi:hypothetical protein COCVIDRAFT_98354, partial [Bipolaris victoriae FI3]